MTVQVLKEFNSKGLIVLTKVFVVAGDQDDALSASDFESGRPDARIAVVFLAVVFEGLPRIPSPLLDLFGRRLLEDCYIKLCETLE